MSDKNVKVEFYHADWCPACKALLPKMAKLEENYKGQVDFVSIDLTDEDMEGAGVDILPTVILYKDDNEERRFTGAFSLKVFDKALVDLLG